MMRRDIIDFDIYAGAISASCSQHVRFVFCVFRQFSIDLYRIALFCFGFGQDFRDSWATIFRHGLANWLAEWLVLLLRNRFLDHTLDFFTTQSISLPDIRVSYYTWTSYYIVELLKFSRFSRFSRFES